MSIGVLVIDDDHKEFINLVNAVEAAAASEDYVVVARVASELLKHAVGHFDREETFMAQVGYPDLDPHRRGHKVIIRRLQLLIEAFNSATRIVDKKFSVGELSELLKMWLLDHILKDDLRLKAFAQRPVEMSVASPRRDEPPLTASGGGAGKPRGDDIQYQLPGHLAHLMARLDYVIPQMPAPMSGFDSFESLCEAALLRRVDKVLIFFQRHNPRIVREMPPFFLASPEFAEKFHAAVRRFVLPTILGNRMVRQLSTNVKWMEMDSENFWDQVERHLRGAILSCWATAWDELRLVPAKKADDTIVLQVKDGTKALREMLAPSSPASYDLPRVTNREIAVFKSLLDTQVDWWQDLNQTWQICHDLYEQEKDPRIFQSRAREGALRDNLLRAFGRFPDSWCDFLVLACHRIFPRVSSQFLESFVASIATSDAVRESYLPYTMRYLLLARDHTEMRQREKREEEAFQEEMKNLHDYLTGRRAD
jgi:hemerythrin-like metal-binding protein